jgi:hypothetical protein
LVYFCIYAKIITYVQSGRKVYNQKYGLEENKIMLEQSQDIAKRTNRGEKNHNQRDVLGIHHVTAITSDPQKNIDFYTGILGLRFVKLTVNQDDPTSYHLYYGDELGRPGTILTFFHWPNMS